MINGPNLAVGDDRLFCCSQFCLLPMSEFSTASQCSSKTLKKAAVAKERQIVNCISTDKSSNSNSSSRCMQIDINAWLCDKLKRQRQPSPETSRKTERCSVVAIFCITASDWPAAGNWPSSVVCVCSQPSEREQCFKKLHNKEWAHMHTLKLTQKRWRPTRRSLSPVQTLRTRTVPITSQTGHTNRWSIIRIDPHSGEGVSRSDQKEWPRTERFGCKWQLPGNKLVEHGDCCCPAAVSQPPKMESTTFKFKFQQK